MKSIRSLPALVAASVALAACGGQTHTASSKASGRVTKTRAAPSTVTTAASGTNGAASSGVTASSEGGSPSNAISKLNDAFKHLTPQQLQAMKARLPAYMHALEQCAKANGGAEAATLACVRSHGFAPAAP